MNNRDIIRNLQDIHERLRRSLTIIEACTETLEMTARNRHASLRAACEDVKGAACDVLLIEKAIANEKEEP